ncbi:MAG: hypothetical protein ACFFFG_00700 [Candidatus Thorarchaeota archaeon]
MSPLNLLSIFLISHLFFIEDYKNNYSFQIPILEQQMFYLTFFKLSKPFSFYAALLLPLSFSWLFIASLVLVYIYDFVDYLNTSSLLPGVDVLLMLIIIAWPVPGALVITGVFLDKYPQYIGKTVLLGLGGSSILLAVYVVSLLVKNGLLIIISAMSLGFLMGILVIASHTLFGGLNINWKKRGINYGVAIFIFEVFSLFVILGIGIIGSDYLIGFTLYSLTGLVLTGIFFYCTRVWSFWANDPWPTTNWQIIKRTSVNVYFWTHTLVYLMIGLMIGSLAEAGTYYNVTAFFGIDLGAYKAFWAGVIFGAGLLILPAGLFVDKFGRKSAIVLATYLIVFAAIIVGLLPENPLSFLFAALIIGIAFAFVHPSLDASVWADLASRDSLSRYYSLGFLSISLGVVMGLILGLFNPFTDIADKLAFNVFILIALAVLASFPLYWTADSSPPLDFFLLLVINDAGLPIFSYNFGKGESLKVDLPLISGALSAVGSFMLEATGEKNASLNLVRHGTHFILSDTSGGLSGAVFSNKNDRELQKVLKRFLLRFESRFQKVLADWNGNIGVFNEAVNDAEEFFGPLVSIS